MASVDRGQPRVLQQDFKRALREAYQVRREQGLTVSRALHDAVDEVWTALIKPLAVINPESREDVERLTNMLGQDFYYGTPGILVASLRQFAAPTPRPAAPTPQIEEPTEVGARVTDHDGEMWVRHVRGEWSCLHSRPGKDVRTWAELVAQYTPITEVPA